MLVSINNPPPETGLTAPVGVELVRAFVNTAELDEGIDRLATAELAQEWLHAQDLIADEPLAESQRLRLIEVRAALRVLIAHGHGGRVDPASLAVLDGAGSTARLTLAFSADGSASLHPDATGVDSALGRILTAAYAAMVEGSWSRLKTCDNDECRWAFYDQSKNRSAKWCSMQSCGNRMKARAYRARRDANS